MPARSTAQQRSMGAELERKRQGKATKTDLTTEQLEEYAATPAKTLPARAPKSKK